MYLTVWKKITSGLSFDVISWNKNLRDTTNYFDLVLDDCQAQYNINGIDGYLIRQYEINLVHAELVLINEAEVVRPLVKRRIINPC